MRNIRCFRRFGAVAVVAAAALIFALFRLLDLGTVTSIVVAVAVALLALAALLFLALCMRVFVWLSENMREPDYHGLTVGNLPTPSTVSGHGDIQETESYDTTEVWE